MYSSVKIDRSSYERTNRLLGLRDMSRMSESILREIGAVCGADELLYIADFDNGVRIELHLVSDETMYITVPKYILPDGRYIFEPDDIAGKGIDEEETFHLNVEPFTGDYIVHLIFQ